MSRPNGARLGSEAPCRPLPPDAHLKAASPALAWAQQKADDGSRRAGWRSFGEYIFLEDSRYASQRKNLPRKQIRPCPPSRAWRRKGREGLGRISLRGKARYILCR